MKKQRVFAAFVVVVGLLIAVGFLLSTTTTTFSSSLNPIRSLVLQEVRKFKFFTPLTPPPPTSSPPTPPPPTPPPSTPPQHPSHNKSTRIPLLSNTPTHHAAPTPASSLAPSVRTRATHLPYISPALEKITDTPDVFKDVPVNATDKDGKKMKIILYWNDSYGNKHFGLGYGRQPFLTAGCRVNTCVATGDRNRYPLSQVDALLWHLRSNDKSFPKRRYPHTRYIFWMMESASYPFSNLKKYRDVFNWTFTYRRDSDFYNPYNRVFRRRHPLPPSPTPVNYAAGKTKMAAWFVSNCKTKSGREDVVKALQKWLPVDIYGRCGRLRCDRNAQGECLAMLEKDYKFYLSFENSLCKDYVTEKFFRALSVNVVPVVWGLGNYSAIAPHHSYIDALAYPSVHALAQYLLYLNTNDTAYNEYFWWKRLYYQAHDWAKKSVAFCELCERLHSHEAPKTYDLEKWFLQDSHCLSYYRDTSIKNYIHVRITNSTLFHLAAGIMTAVVFLAILYCVLAILTSPTCP